MGRSPAQKSARLYPLRGVARDVERLTVPVGPLQCNCHIVWKKPDQALVIDPGDEGEKIAQRGW